LDVRDWNKTAVNYMMSNFIISRLLLAKFYDDDKIREEVGRASSTYGTKQSCIQTFGVRT
jgi:lantibiotic modifying enzyme